MLVECKRIKSPLLKKEIALSISSKVDIPVDKIIGTPFVLKYFNISELVRQAEGTLKHIGLNCSIKSIEGISQQEANQSMPSFLQ